MKFSNMFRTVTVAATLAFAAQAFAEEATPIDSAQSRSMTACTLPLLTPQRLPLKLVRSSSVISSLFTAV